ncbi:transcriptional regulator [Pseudonocardiaceae bacterium YIM PH 21723]|nr:transcriptional regulator [Pseudonocardiaceae bacterium YIM PH 21723]
MTEAANKALRDLIAAGRPETNNLVPLLESGQAGPRVVGALAAEQRHIVPGDQRALAALAGRSTGAVRELFQYVSDGDGAAFELLPALALGCGWTRAEFEAYEPSPGCMSYSAGLCWLSVNAEPAKAAIALLSNFAEWGEYCSRVSSVLRERHGLDATATAFLDFFGASNPELDRLAAAAIQEGLDSGAITDGDPEILRYARLLRAYEHQFWNTLAGF